MDWTSIISPAIIVAVPLFTALIKRFIPDKAKTAIPVVAVALGPILDAVVNGLASQPSSATRGLVLGASGVALREIVNQAKKDLGAVAPLILLPFMLMMASPAQAQAVCDTGVAPTTSVCGPSNKLSWVVSTTNTDATPLNNLSNFNVLFGPNATLCSAQGVPTVGTTVRNVGNLGVPPAPLVNTNVNVVLSTLNIPNGLTFISSQETNLVGTVSQCAGPLQFTFAGSIPAPPTGIKVGP